MFAINNRNNFFNHDMSLLDDMFFDQGFLNHSMQSRFAYEPFRLCDVQTDPRRKALQMNRSCVPSFYSKRRQPMALTFDMLPFKRSRQNYFDEMMKQMVSTKNDQFGTIGDASKSWNIENLSDIDPKNLKIKIDKNSNSLSINYQKKSDNSYYQISETKSLPNFIKEHDLFEKIKCNFENGQVKISFPEEPKAIVDKKVEKTGAQEVEVEIEGEAEAETDEKPEMVSIYLVSEEEEKEMEDEKKKQSDEESEDKTEKIVMPGLE